MKRSHFIASLLGLVGIAEGQEPSSKKDGIAWHGTDNSLWYKGPDGKKIQLTDEFGNTIVHWSRSNKPLNNQCPVCGTMAKPFKQELGTLVYRGEPVLLGHSWLPLVETGSGSLSQTLVRCRRCNAAFWQDAE